MRRWSITLTLGAALAVGCGRTLPPTRHYRLSLPPAPLVTAQPGPRCADGRGPSLAVEELEVDAAYDDERIVYRKSEFRLERYDYHLWGTAPGRMVSDALRSGYMATQQFERVRSGWDADVDAILRGRVLALEEVDRSPTEWFGHVALELELVDGRTEARLWSQRYESSVPLPKRSPEGLAAAVSAVLGEVVEQSAPILADTIVSQPGGCPTHRVQTS